MKVHNGSDDIHAINRFIDYLCTFSKPELVDYPSMDSYLIALKHYDSISHTIHHSISYVVRISENPDSSVSF